jgi:hypothetical protein
MACLWKEMLLSCLGFLEVVERLDRGGLRLDRGGLDLEGD